MGIDGCTYWPPDNATQILKHDPHHTDQTSLVGDDNGHSYDEWKKWKWKRGTLAADEVIYRLPTSTEKVLVFIDPWTELSMNVKNNMKGHLEPLKFLFQINDSHPASNRTYFDCAVTKFGIHRAFKVMEECMPPDDRVCVRIPICTPS